MKRTLSNSILIATLFLGLSTLAFAPIAGAVVNPGYTPCEITAINAATGLVTARANATGQVFQFSVNDAALLKTLRAGQAIYADFGTQNVSLDGVRPFGRIVQAAIKAPLGPGVAGPPPGAIPTAPVAGPRPGTIPTAPVAGPRPGAIPTAPVAGSRPGTIPTAPVAGPGTVGQAATSGTKSKGGLDSIKPGDIPPVTTSSEPSTAGAIRGRPETPSSAAKQPAPGTTEFGSQSQALNPEIILLQTTSDLVAKDLGFTGLPEITFNLVNRGKVGINVSEKQGSAATVAAQAPPSGPPISIDIWMGTSKMTIQQPSMGGTQTKNFKVPIPSNYSKPKCLETRNLKVVVDPQNQIKELHDDNNVTEATNSARPCPDLAIKSIERHYTGLLNETYQPKVTIINKGNAPSPSTQVWGTSLPGGVWPVTGWPELIPIHTIPALAPGETTSFRTGGSVVVGNHTAVRVILDRDNKIEESDESNNFEDKRL